MLTVLCGLSLLIIQGCKENPGNNDFLNKVLANIDQIRSDQQLISPLSQPVHPEILLNLILTIGTKRNILIRQTHLLVLLLHGFSRWTLQKCTFSMIYWLRLI
jgi:hypothetical protein